MVQRNQTRGKIQNNNNQVFNETLDLKKIMQLRRTAKVSFSNKWTTEITSEFLPSLTVAF